MDDAPTPRLQFGTRRLLLAIALLACAFSIVNLSNRLDKASNDHPLIGVVLFPAFWAFLCGGIGALRGRIAEWVAGGLIIWAIFSIVRVMFLPA